MKRLDQPARLSLRCKHHEEQVSGPLLALRSDMKIVSSRDENPALDQHEHCDRACFIIDHIEQLLSLLRGLIECIDEETNPDETASGPDAAEQMSQVEYVWRSLIGAPLNDRCCIYDMSSTTLFIEADSRETARKIQELLRDGNREATLYRETNGTVVRVRVHVANVLPDGEDVPV